jgi:TIGR03009 family protein
MRTFGWSLMTLLLLAPVLCAQQLQPPARGAASSPPAQNTPARGAPAGQPALNVPAPDPKLDSLLQQWSQKMTSIQGFEAKVERQDKDALVKNVDTYEGFVRFLRPNRADLYLVKKTNPPQDPRNPQIFERFLCTGNFLYEFQPQGKIIRAHELPQRAAGQPMLDDSFLSFLFGMNPEEAKRRFDMQIVISANPTENEWYIFLQITPRLAADKTDFTMARLILYQANKPNAFLPAQMELIQPNNNVITWKILSINPAASIPATAFQKPGLPQGWQFVNVPLNPTPPAAIPGGAPRQGGAATPPPTVIRQKGGD